MPAPGPAVQFVIPVCLFQLVISEADPTQGALLCWLGEAGGRAEGAAITFFIPLIRTQGSCVSLVSAVCGFVVER
jgi:hypothetical protein